MTYQNKIESTEEFVAKFERITQRKLYCRFYGNFIGSGFVQASTALSRLLNGNPSSKRNFHTNYNSGKKTYYKDMACCGVLCTLIEIQELEQTSRGKNYISFRKDKNRDEVFGLKFDLDFEDSSPIDSLEACRSYCESRNTKPSLIVQTSPTRFHVVFLFQKLFSDSLGEIIESLKVQLNSDPRCSVYSSLDFKIPGSINPKNGFVVTSMWLVSSTEELPEMPIAPPKIASERLEEDLGALPPKLELVMTRLRRPFEGHVPQSLLALSQSPHWEAFLRQLIVTPHLSSGGNVSQKAIAASLKVHWMTINRLVKLIEKNGYVECVDRSYEPRKKAMSWVAKKDLLDLHIEAFESSGSGKPRLDAAIEWLDENHPLDAGCTNDAIIQWFNLCVIEIGMQKDDFLDVLEDYNHGDATRDQFEARYKSLKKTFRSELRKRKPKAA